MGGRTVWIGGYGRMICTSHDTSSRSKMFDAHVADRIHPISMDIRPMQDIAYLPQERTWTVND